MTPLDGNTHEDLKNETYALKIINKSVLHPEEINIIRGESKILKSLVGLPNVVQFMNIFETHQFIII
jgi:serine/threonine protein kinase